MTWFVPVLALLLALLASLAGWRFSDRRHERSTWRALATTGSHGTAVFDPDILARLPEPARRYFSFTIQAGTPLRSVVEVQMHGELGLGTKAAPNYRPMRARQLLAPPQGFIWSLRSGAISGSDGAAAAQSWTRFWLFHCIPVARVSGYDHRRSAFGRLVADSIIWAPASVLPGDHVSWEPLDNNSARVTMRSGALEQSVDLHVDNAGAPVKIVFQRWSDENPQRRYRLQPFGGELSEFRDFGGYTLPTRVSAGNHYGTADYFPFFKAHVTDVSFPCEPAT